MALPNAYSHLSLNLFTFGSGRVVFVDGSFTGSVVEMESSSTSCSQSNTKCCFKF